MFAYSSTSVFQIPKRCFVILCDISLGISNGITVLHAVLLHAADAADMESFNNPNARDAVHGYCFL